MQEKHKQTTNARSATVMHKHKRQTKTHNFCLRNSSALCNSCWQSAALLATELEDLLLIYGARCQCNDPTDGQRLLQAVGQNADSNCC